jgi:hypothetical protein
MNEEATEVTLLVVDVLDRIGIPYVIVGSLVSSLYGLARSTLDADLVADIKQENVRALYEGLQDAFYVTEEEINNALKYRGSFNVIHLDSVFKVDLFVPKNRPFDARQFRNRQLEVVASNPDRSAYVASAEDTILAKLEWYQIGEGISDRQWQDILGIVKTQADRLNLQYLREGAAELAVGELLEQALTPER